MGEVIPFPGQYRSEEEWEAIMTFQEVIVNAAKKVSIHTKSLEYGSQVARQAEDTSNYTAEPLANPE